MRLTRLLERRERALLTQQELADRAGISRTAISAIERLKAEPQFSTIRKLAQALDCEPADLMPEV
jgi:transcriptional regulator with XRE-family HTH domain